MSESARSVLLPHPKGRLISSAFINHAAIKYDGYMTDAILDRSQAHHTAMSSTLKLTTTYANTCPTRNAAAVLHLRATPNSIQDGSLTITPVMVSSDSAFGAEVSGIDWSRPIPTETIKQVRLSRSCPTHY
jgi:hypothetical protein